MERSGPFVVVLVLLVVSAPLAIVPALADGPTARAPPVTQGEFDQVEFHVTVYENASARWTFRYRRTLANESERRQFEEFARRFNENETELYRDFRARAEQLTARGSNVTGRDMTARSFSKRAYTTGTGVQDNLGVVRMSFVWTAFAAEEGDRLVVGDVFQDGLYIGQDQKFVVQQGPGLTIVEATPEPDSTSSDSVTWEGERSFNDERPHVVLVPEGAAGTTGSATPSENESGPGGDGFGGSGLLPVLALLAVLALGVGAVYAYRSDGLGRGGTTDAASGDGGSAGGAGPNPGPAISDEELLSDDDRVMQLLEDHGGRMKQVNIVEDTGWSKSKVSMLLSDMEEEGQISKLRVGRENIVSIAGQEPDAAGSPFEDDE